MSAENNVTSGLRKVVIIWPLVRVSHRFLFRNLGAFLQLGWMPILVSYVTRSLLADGRPTTTWYFLALLLGLWLQVWFLVRWYRLVLLNRRETGFQGLWARRNLHFLGYYLLLDPMILVLAGFAYRGFTGTPPGVYFPFLGFLFLYRLVMLRFILILPSVTLEAPLGLQGAWSHMTGNTWRTIGALILVGIIPATLFIPVGLGSRQLTSFPVVVQALKLLSSLIFFLWTAISATAISKIYQGLVEGDMLTIPPCDASQRRF